MQIAWNNDEITIYPPEQHDELKRAFGEALCRHPSNPYEAARQIEPSGHTGRANWIVHNWLDDPIVVEASANAHKEHGAKAGIPSKEELVLAMFREKDEIRDYETRLKYYKAIAEIMDYVPRNGGININNQIVNQPKVMKVPHFRSADEWEASAVEHQQQLAET